MSQPGLPPQPQPPAWGPPPPPQPKGSGRVVAVAVGATALVVVAAVVLAFLGFVSPGFWRPAGDGTGFGVAAGGGRVSTSVVPPPGTEPLTVPDQRTPMPKRTTPLPDPQNCTFPADAQAPTGGKAATPPPAGPQPASGTIQVGLVTSAGEIALTLDRALAPCTVASFLSLAKHGFYTGTSCHRLSVLDGLQMLQCGDPLGDGTGGPGYRVPDEVFPQLTYGRGVLAMANTGQPDSGGSQFFMVYGSAELPPSYTVFGSISDGGLQVLDKVAKAGVDPARLEPDGSGRPVLPVTFSQVIVP